jgi:hypothetical protein
MLLLDHQYRELKGNFMKGNTKKLSEELKLPVTEKIISKLKNGPTEDAESQEVSSSFYYL